MKLQFKIVLPKRQQTALIAHGQVVLNRSSNFILGSNFNPKNLKLSHEFSNGNPIVEMHPILSLLSLRGHQVCCKLFP